MKCNPLLFCLCVVLPCCTGYQTPWWHKYIALGTQRQKDCYDWGPLVSKKKSNKTKHLINQGLGHLRWGIYKPSSTPQHLSTFKTIRVGNRAGGCRSVCRTLAYHQHCPWANQLFFDATSTAFHWMPTTQGCFEDLWHVLLSLLSFCFSLRQGLAVHSWLD